MKLIIFNENNSIELDDIRFSKTSEMDDTTDIINKIIIEV